MTPQNNEHAIALRSVEPTEVTPVATALPLTTEAVVNQQRRIAHCMAEVMRDKVDYGTIPGTTKPSLFKPGSEKILAMFRIAVDPEVVDLSIPGECVRYRVTCRLLDQQSHAFLGAGVGEASSEEARYNWRAAICDEEFDEAPPESKREKWEKRYGKTSKVRQVRTNPADQANTILKMAKKRAQIDAVLTVTAASAIFTQDLEDLPAELLGEITNDKKPVSGQFAEDDEATVQEPQARSGSKPAHPQRAQRKPRNTEAQSDTSDNPVRGMKDGEIRVIACHIAEVDTREGENKRGKYTQTFVKFTNGLKASGFHDTFPEELAHAAEAGAQVVVRVKRSGKYLNLESIEEVLYDVNADTADALADAPADAHDSDGDDNEKF